MSITVPDRCILAESNQLIKYSSPSNSQTEALRQHSSQQIIDWDPISLGFLVYIGAVCRL